jgi:hypothetical protein
MILRGSALLLNEAVAKFNCLVKSPSINRGRRFIYQGTKNVCLAKMINGSGWFIYRGG